VSLAVALRWRGSGGGLDAAACRDVLLGAATLNYGQLAKAVVGAVESFDGGTRRATEAGEGSKGGEEGGDSLWQRMHAKKFSS
jgi:hypothetical protein